MKFLETGLIDQKDLTFPVLQNEHRFLQEFLIRLGNTGMFLVAIQDIQTKIVCLYNERYREFWGLPEENSQDMTVSDILRRIKHFKNVESVLSTMAYHEKQAIATGDVRLFQQAYLSCEGLVGIHQSLMVPIRDTRHRLMAMGDFRIDITPYFHPLQILKYYRFFYPKRSEAVRKVFSYFKLNVYFYKILSYEEIRLLFTMVEDIRHKRIAENLHISSKTASNYIASIRSKLKPEFELYALVSHLRAQSQYSLCDYPTVPSNFNPSSFCASTANSIGSF